MGSRRSTRGERARGVGAAGESGVRRGREHRSSILSQGQVDSPSLILLVILATLGTALYAWFLLDPNNAGDPLPYTMVVVCETFLIFQILLTLWTALSSTHNPRNFGFHAAQRDLVAVDGDLRLDGRSVSIDVLIPTYGEPTAVVRRTVEAALRLTGDHRTVVCDDAGSPEIRTMAEELGARYVARATNRGAKAGNLNDYLATSDAEFFVIFDADFVAEPQFLVETLPFFADENVAFVQTPQVYGNVRGFISRASAFSQTVFYTLTQPGKNRFNAAFCVGTNVIFRRRAIDAIGGIYEESKSEDIWTSIRLHEAGWRTIYVPRALAVGETPDSISSFSRQQVRWATGAFEILLTHNPLSPRRRLSTDQRLQYLTTTTFYFSGIIPLLLIVLPPLQIYLDLTPISTSVPVWQWMLYYCGFYGMQILMAFFIIGSFRWETLILFAASFPIYAKAFANALLRRSGSWHVTGKQGRSPSPFLFIRIQIYAFVFLLLTTVFGVWKANWTGQFSIALAWNTVNTLILGAIVMVGITEAVALRRERRSTPVEGATAEADARPAEADADARLIVVGGAA